MPTSWNYRITHVLIRQQHKPEKRQIIRHRGLMIILKWKQPQMNNILLLFMLSLKIQKHQPKNNPIALYEPPSYLITSHVATLEAQLLQPKRPDSSYVWFSYCTTIVSTTLNPNSPGYTDGRSILFSLIPDICFFHKIIWADRAHRGHCGWTCFTGDFCKQGAWSKYEIIENFPVLKWCTETTTGCC